MNKIVFLVMITLWACLYSCGRKEQDEKIEKDSFVYQTEQFADVKILRYKVPGFEELDLNTKLLIYYLYEAGLAGRDIYWDQNYRHNLLVRKTLEEILTHYSGDRSSEAFEMFTVYAKRVFVANGIHHQNASDKLLPEFDENYFSYLINNSPEASFPISGVENLHDFTRSLIPVIFYPHVDSRKIESDPSKDIIKKSATNYYHEDLTFDAVKKFYDVLVAQQAADPRPVSLGLNSKLMLDEQGNLYEDTWKKEGMYGEAISRIVYWLKKAVDIAESKTQKSALNKLIAFYMNGDLRTFDAYSVLWVQDTASFVDVVNGFIEVYDDPIGRRGAYQSMVSIKDKEASSRTQIISSNAQWFEDNLSIHDAYKKEEAFGITARAINVVGLAGDNTPTPPIGVNLPNADWIRAEYGSKSVTISNIIHAHNEATKTSGAIEEFAYSQKEIDRAKEHGALGFDLLIDLHEIIGHGSGQLKPGVADPATTLKNYASPLEEARADLVALYFLTDPKLVELGLMSSLEVGKAQYESYIRGGMLTQLVRIEPGRHIEQAHMRARKLISEWAIEKGKTDNVIEKIIREGKTYFVINDYEKLRAIFGEMLKEIQRIKSEGDFEAGKYLIENYAISIDPKLHKEVISRWEKLNIAPFTAFINPVLTPVYEGAQIIDIKISYPDDFLEQMLYYGKKYSFLPVYN